MVGAIRCPVTLEYGPPAGRRPVPLDGWLPVPADPSALALAVLADRSCPAEDPMTPQGRSRADKPLCGNCTRRPVKARARCATCLRYLERTGFDRSVDVFMRGTQRDEERRLRADGRSG